MTALATLDDLKSNGIEVTDEQTATSLLDSVSDAVRSAAGCPITLGEWTVDIPGEQSRKLDLPCKAVRSVSRVLIDGKTVYDWRLLGSSLYREEPWSPFGRIPSVVTVGRLESDTRRRRQTRLLVRRGRTPPARGRWPRRTRRRQL